MYFKYFLITLLVLFTIFIIIKIILFILNFLKLKNALNMSLVNTNKCGQKICPLLDNTQQNLPQIMSLIDWQLDIAKYCSYIIYNIEQQVLNNTKANYPTELSVLKEIYEENSNILYGVVFLDTNDDVWIVFRGSQTKNEWQDDFKFQQESYLDTNSSIQSQTHFLQNNQTQSPSIHKGFLDFYNIFRQQIIDLNINKSKKIIICGHSLGAAIATLNGIDMKQQGYNNTVVYNFASPRIGDQVFADLVNSQLKVFRVVNECDIIPTLPLAVTPNITSNNFPFIYVHCGEQKMFSDNWLSILNNHLLPVYINGLKNFLN
jgi:triacylglycerol lipase